MLKSRILGVKQGHFLSYVMVILYRNTDCRFGPETFDFRSLLRCYSPFPAFFVQNQSVLSSLLDLACLSFFLRLKLEETDPAMTGPRVRSEYEPSSCANEEFKPEVVLS